MVDTELDAILESIDDVTTDVDWVSDITGDIVQELEKLKALLLSLRSKLCGH